MSWNLSFADLALGSYLKQYRSLGAMEKRYKNINRLQVEGILMNPNTASTFNDNTNTYSLLSPLKSNIMPTVYILFYHTNAGKYFAFSQRNLQVISK